MPAFNRSCAMLCAGTLLTACGSSELPLSSATPLSPVAGSKWVSSWGAATTSAFPSSYNTDPATRSNTAGSERSLRLVARSTLGGTAVRVRLTNVFGRTPLTIGAASVALRGVGASLVPGSRQAVTFDGATSTVIPAGAQRLSDPVPLTTQAGADLAVSLYLPGTVLTPSIHAQAFQTNFVSANNTGDLTAQDSGAGFTGLNTSVPILEGLDVLTTEDAGAIVVLGDSLSDGVGSTFDGHDRWPDQLARRLQAAGIPQAIVNAGLTGNSIDCAIGLPQDGPDAVERLDRDVLSKAGINAVFLFEGTNDLANFCTATQLQAAITTLVAHLHAKGIPVIGATLIPRIDLHFSPQAEIDRQTVNAWIRTGQVFDEFIDFDVAVRAADGGWNAQYDSGDQVHLNPAGYLLLANVVDLNVLERLKSYRSAE